MAETKDTDAGSLSVAGLNSIVGMSAHGEHGRVVGLNLTTEGLLALLAECVFGGKTITRADSFAFNVGQKQNGVLYADGFVLDLNADTQTPEEAAGAVNPSHVVMPSEGEDVAGAVPEITNPGVTDGGAPVDPTEPADVKAKRNDAKTRPQTEDNR